MLCYSKDSDYYEFLLCFCLKCTIKYFDFYIDILRGIRNLSFQHYSLFSYFQIDFE